MVRIGMARSEDDALRLTEELLFCIECKASTYYQYDRSRFVDLWCLVIGFFYAPLVLTFSGGGHIQFRSGRKFSGVDSLELLCHKHQAPQIAWIWF